MSVNHCCIAAATACLLLITLPGDALEITEAPRDQKVVERGIVSLVCRATGDPLPVVYWRRAGRRLTSSRLPRYTFVAIADGSVLRIEPVRKRWDEGVIECVANNDVGDKVTAAANIVVYEDGTAPAGYPKIVENPTLKAVDRGRRTVMACSAWGIPEPTISWFKDMVPVDLTDGRLRILPTGSLQINRSLESDEGKYECVAENSLGVVYSYCASLYVRVRRVPPHFTILPDDVKVTPGGAVNLTCVAIGSPMPFVTWRHGAVELTPADDAPIGKNVLMLTDVRETATYTCVATSELGTIENDAEVKVKDF